MFSLIRLVFLSFLIFFQINLIFGQRFAYVDSDYILKSLPEYITAEKVLRQKVKVWDEEIKIESDILNKMQIDFENEKVLLTEELKNEKIETIKLKAKQLEALKLKYFGENGEMIKLENKLIKPLEGKIWNAIEKITLKKDLDFIFDKANNNSILYSNPKYDVSDEILKIFTISPTEKKEKENNK